MKNPKEKDVIKRHTVDCNVLDKNWVRPKRSNLDGMGKPVSEQNPPKVTQTTKVTDDTPVG